ncbi:MAG: hypothetical protein NZ578_05900 [Candidatus Binatia bacterium]|nr:hypothetical protein [Candidatus Binatia bacterium]
MGYQLSCPLPSWMTYLSGEVPIVLIAPHGGRRPADAPIHDHLKVNDLYTAELTTALAIRIGAYALINHQCDRNDLDLNRISQVRARAPWFLEAVHELLAALVEAHGAVRVFFIHGWNVVQPVCDLGMGLKPHGHRLLPPGKAAPTVTPAFFHQVVLPFRTAAEAQGIEVAFGRRYPAADRENVLQLFSARFAADPSPTIRTLATLALQGKVNALQLELGIGLRWPGPERERFLDVFARTLGNATLGLSSGAPQEFACPSIPSSPASVVRSNGTFIPSGHTVESTRLGLHFHDPASGVGILGGIEWGESAPTSSGRLLISLGGTEMIMFTGEDDARCESEQIRIGRLVWQHCGDGLAISYRGPMMRFAHPQAFIRLEEGLAASWIEPAEVRLCVTLPSTRTTPALPLFLAHLRGEVRLRDRRHAIDAWGFVDRLQPSEAGRLLPRRLLSLPFGPDLAAFLSWVETPDGPRASGILYHDGTPYVLQPEEWELRCTLAHGRPVAFHLSLTSAQAFTLHCAGEPITAIPIVRHAPHGRALNVTFGLSRAVWQGRAACGVYEYSEPRRG